MRKREKPPSSFCRETLNAETKTRLNGEKYVWEKLKWIQKEDDFREGYHVGSRFCKFPLPRGNTIGTKWKYIDLAR